MFRHFSPVENGRTAHKKTIRRGYTMMARIVLLAGLALAGCDFFSSDVAEGTLRFSPEGISGDRDFKVAYFEVFEFNSSEVPDTFEIRGAEAAVTGKLSPMSQLGQGEGWKKL